MRLKLLVVSSLLVPTLVLILAGNRTNVFAHGGEDHGEQKPATATTNGMITRTVRLGDLELMLKHGSLEPDTATLMRLFITEFATNAPANNVSPAIEIESSNGNVIEAVVEKAETVGTYFVKIPALAEGKYVVRAKITLGGEVDTATFSGVGIGHEEAVPPSLAGSSWAQTGLSALLFLVGFVLFGGLVYLAIRAVNTNPVNEEAVAV